jgi:hypothetical protein
MSTKERALRTYFLNKTFDLNKQPIRSAGYIFTLTARIKVVDIKLLWGVACLRVELYQNHNILVREDGIWYNSFEDFPKVYGHVIDAYFTQYKRYYNCPFLIIRINNYTLVMKPGT